MTSAELLLGIVAAGGASAAAYTDWRSRTIPNVLTYGLVSAGLLIGLMLNNTASHALGLVVGFVPALLLFYMGSIGGGDVKLLGGLGAIVGYPLVVDVLFWSLALGTLGSLLVVVLSGRFRELVRGFVLLVYSFVVPGAPKVPPVNDIKIPLAVAIAGAVLVPLLIPTLRVSPGLKGLLY